jgi:hypothetical protein
MQWSAATVMHEHDWSLAHAGTTGAEKKGTHAFHGDAPRPITGWPQGLPPCLFPWHGNRLKRLAVAPLPHCLIMYSVLRTP